MAFVCLCLGAQNVLLQAQRPIAVTDFTERSTFRPRLIYGLRWMRDGSRYSTLEENRIVVYDVATGQQTEVLLDGAQLPEALTIQGYAFSPDEQKILLTTHRESIYRYSYTAIYYVYDRISQTLDRLAAGRQAYATFAPQGQRIAYTRDNNLYYRDLANQNEVAVTTDGEIGKIINGSSDWVYEEELTLTRAFEWSADGKRLAYYRFDESEVNSFNMQLWQGTSPYPIPYTFKYPKAGEKNAQVQLFIYELATKERKKIALGNEQDHYIPRIRWTRNPLLLSVERLNRLQNQREVLHVNAQSAQAQVVLKERSDTYVDFTFCDDLTYLKDGKHFIYSSEESGYKHFYLHHMSGKRLRPITQGNYEAEKLIGIDQSNQRQPILYYLSTEGGFMERQLYGVGIQKGDRRQLTRGKGMHRVLMSRDFSHYIDIFSSPQQVPQISLFRTKDNTLVKKLQKNQALAVATKEHGFVDKEYFSFTGKDNSLLYGYLLKPPNIEEGSRYPCLVYQYSGPGSQSVTKGWGGSHYAYHQLLVQQGFVVAVVDTRGTGGRGAAFKKATYGQMGKYESEDLDRAARYLQQLPYVVVDQIGIWGWSYGGYMSSLSLFLKGSPYQLAVAVAPVGSWRFYDTIYTERYLKRPQENASGYDDYSPITHAASMRGDYLLVHGTGDDNVHFQNAIALQDALIKAGKHFSSFYYPNEAHALSGVRTHLYKTMLAFLNEKLGSSKPLAQTLRQD